MVRSSLVALAGLALVVLLAACGGGGEPTPTATATVGPATPTPLVTPTPSATPTPTLTTTPEAIGGVEVVPLEVGEEAQIPDDVALIIETGCFDCDGPTAGLVRLYRDASGELRTDTLFTAKALHLPPRGVAHSKDGDQPLEPFIHSYAISSDASQIVVSVCTRGECAWIDEASPDAQTTLYRSLDGGVTWSEFGVLDGSHFVVAMAEEGPLIRGLYEQGPDSRPTYELFPGGQPVQPPPGAGEAWPLSLPNGELIWWYKDGRLLRSDGSELLDLGEDVTSVNIWRKNIQLDPGGRQLAIVWWTQRPGETSGQNYLAVGTTDGTLARVFSVRAYAGVGGWVDSRLLIGNAAFSPEELGTTDANFFGYLPALFNLDTGEAHPLTHPFLDPSFGGGRNHIQAVLHGPFARVVNTGACLNVRAEPAMAAPVLACAADGVLLRDAGETRQADGATWRRVVTPAGVEGWASSQYLER